MRKIVLVYGLIAGAIMSLMMIVTMWFSDRIGLDKGEILGYTSMVVAFLMIFVGVKTYRDTIGGGMIAFAGAFKVGLLIMGLASTCYVATWEVIYYAAMPDFADKYAQQTLKHARESGATPAQLAEQQQKMDQFKQLYRNPVYNVALSFLEPLPVGLVMTLVAAGVLRRKKPAGAPAP